MLFEVAVSSEVDGAEASVLVTLSSVVVTVASTLVSVVATVSVTDVAGSISMRWLAPPEAAAKPAAPKTRTPVAALMRIIRLLLVKFT